MTKYLRGDLVRINVAGNGDFWWSKGDWGYIHNPPFEGEHHWGVALASPASDYPVVIGFTSTELTSVAWWLIEETPGNVRVAMGVREIPELGYGDIAVYGPFAEREALEGETCWNNDLWAEIMANDAAMNVSTPPLYDDSDYFNL